MTLTFTDTLYAHHTFLKGRTSYLTFYTTVSRRKPPMFRIVQYLGRYPFNCFMACFYATTLLLTTETLVSSMSAVPHCTAQVWQVHVPKVVGQVSNILE